MTCNATSQLTAFFKILEDIGNPSQGQIIVFTDGEETQSPYIASIADEVCRKVSTESNK